MDADDVAGSSPSSCTHWKYSALTASAGDLERDIDRVSPTLAAIEADIGEEADGDLRSVESTRKSRADDVYGASTKKRK